MTKAQLFCCLTYADADRAIEFLTALGLTERLVVRDPDDPTQVRHAQFRWRETGGVMFGSVRADDELGFASTPGAGRTNLVVTCDEAVDETVQRALAAGGRLVQEPQHQPYGGRSAAVADPEGNLWNIDSYEGE